MPRYFKVRFDVATGNGDFLYRRLPGSGHCDCTVYTVCVCVGAIYLVTYYMFNARLTHKYVCILLFYNCCVLLFFDLLVFLDM